MRRTTLFVAAFVAALAAGSAVAQGDDEDDAADATEQTEEPAASADVEAPSPPSAEVLALNPLAALEKSSLSGFRDMPLFTPSRRRPVPPPVVETAAAPPPPPRQEPPASAPELKLAGVVEGPDGSVAVVDNGGRVERLRLGDQVDGWLVTQIGPSSLKLTLDEREEEFRLFQRSEASAASSDDEDEDERPAKRPKRKRPSNADDSDDDSN